MGVSHERGTPVWTVLRILFFMDAFSPVSKEKRIFIELMTPDPELNASREGSTLRIYRT